MPSFRYDILTTFAARVLAMVGPFGVSIITARVLGPEERGRYFLVLAIAQVGVQIAGLGLQSSNTYLVAKRPYRVGRLVANSFVIAFVVAPVVTAVVALLFGWPELLGLGLFFGGSLGPVSLLSVLIAPLMLYSLYISNLALGTGRVQLFNALTIVYSLLALAVASIMASIGAGITLFLLGTGIAVAIPAMFGTIRVLAGRPIPKKFDGKLFGRGVSFAARVYLATMFGFLMNRVGLFALQYQAGIEEVGQFSVATQLADGLMMLPSTVGILLFPKLLKIDGDDRWTAMWQVFGALAAIMLVLLPIVGLLAPMIVSLMFGAPFARAAVLLAALLPSILLFSLITVISQYLSSMGFPKFQVMTWLIGLVVQTGLSFWLVGLWGGLGVAAAIAISSTLVFALLLFEAYRIRRGTS